MQDSFLSYLEVFNLRNLKHIQANFNRINLIVGKNGSGKTSLLESIYHLSFGRSFRTRNVNRIIQRDFNKFSIFSRLYNGTILGLEKHSTGETRIKLNGQPINSASVLIEEFPAQIINPDVYQLITEGPGIRRQFIDWGVFHVEHASFLENLKKLNKTLKQRNALLKEGFSFKNQITSWNYELIELAHIVDKARKAYLSIFEPVFFELLKKLLDLKEEITIGYYPGWNFKKPYEEILEHSLSRDIQFGYTNYGPHKADLRVCIEGIPVSDVLSRGQLKLLVCAMRLAQAALIKKSEDRRCVLLIDDLTSELDDIKRALFANLLLELDTQIFITSTEKSELEDLFSQSFSHGNSKISMFHVEHGQFI